MRRNADQQTSARLDLLKLLNQQLPLTGNRRTLRPSGTIRLKTLFLQTADQLIAVLHRAFPHLCAIEHCAVGVGFGEKSACTLENGTQFVAFFNTVAPRMQHLPAHVDSAADIGPSTKLRNREHVAGLENDVGIRLAGESFSDCNFAVLQLNVIAVHYGVACEIGRVRVRAALEAAGKPHQFRGRQAVRQWVFARTKHLAED